MVSFYRTFICNDFSLWTVGRSDFLSTLICYDSEVMQLCLGWTVSCLYSLNVGPSVYTNIVQVKSNVQPWPHPDDAALPCFPVVGIRLMRRANSELISAASDEYSLSPKAFLLSAAAPTQTEIASWRHLHSLFPQLCIVSLQEGCSSSICF